MPEYNQLHIEGLDELFKILESKSAEIQARAMVGLQKAGMHIIADSQVNLRANRTNVTGVLSQSGKVQKVSDESLEVGFFADGNATGYAEFVEYGRRAGKMPPPDALIQWAYKKFALPHRAMSSRRNAVSGRRNAVSSTGSISRVPVNGENGFAGLDAEAVGWMMAKKIAKRGTTPHPFFKPAVDSNRDRIKDAVAEAVVDAIK